MHVDGAFGLWVKASPARKALARGVELADSWSLDGHKTLNTSYDCGIVLCRQRDSLVAAMQASGAYIPYSDHRDGMMHVPEMSRRARAVDLWATLRYLGRNGVAEMIDGMCVRAGQFAGQLAARRFRILNEVVFNQVRVAGDRRNRPGKYWRTSSRQASVGAAGRNGTTNRPFASVSAHGSPPLRTWTDRWKRLSTRDRKPGGTTRMVDAVR